MTTSAPRIDSRLLGALERIYDADVPIAETNRRLGEIAEHLGLKRPSYEQVRVLVHRLEELGASPGVGELLLEVALRARSPHSLLDNLPPPRAQRRL